MFAMEIQRVKVRCDYCEADFSDYIYMGKTSLELHNLQVHTKEHVEKIWEREALESREKHSSGPREYHTSNKDDIQRRMRAALSSGEITIPGVRSPAALPSSTVGLPSRVSGLVRVSAPYGVSSYGALLPTVQARTSANNYSGSSIPCSVGTTTSTQFDALVGQSMLVTTTPGAIQYRLAGAGSGTQDLGGMNNQGMTQQDDRVESEVQNRPETSKKSQGRKRRHSTDSNSSSDSSTDSSEISVKASSKRKQHPPKKMARKPESTAGAKRSLKAANWEEFDEPIFSDLSEDDVDDNPEIVLD